MNERRYDIDWLRVIAMLAIFVFHSTRFFDPEGWHLKNPEQSVILFVAVRGLIWPWVMESLLPAIRSGFLVRAKIQARGGVSLGADQAASHPSLYGGSLYPAAASVLLRTPYQRGV